MLKNTSFAVLTPLSPSDHWHSLPSIVDAIKQSWRAYGIKFKSSVEFIDVNFRDLKHSEIPLSQAQVLIFPWNGFKLIAEIRKNMAINVPAIIYVHGEGTIGFSRSTHELPYLRVGDVFVTASLSEKRTVDYCFKKVQTIVCPYPLGVDRHDSQIATGFLQKDLVRLLYVGRLSEQKNVHTLLMALRLVVDRAGPKPIRLDIYGNLDNIGSPNMAVGATDYSLVLMSLVKELKLESFVHWHGFVRREILQDLVQAAHHIFVTASLHSDECFGMAAFDSLLHGNSAVLTDWGGHQDLSHKFRNLVTLVPVQMSKRGPFISPFDLANKIVISLLTYAEIKKKRRKFRLPKYYGLDSITTSLRKAIHLLAPEPKVLEPTLWAKKVHAQVKSFNSIAGLHKLHIYSNYSDPLVEPIFLCYGMSPSVNSALQAHGKFVWAPPWVEFDRIARKVTVHDPHRGLFELTLKIKSKLYFRIRQIGRNHVDIPEAGLTWLIQLGCVYIQKNPILTAVKKPAPMKD
jgi:glycosyltransferase involved in cell wall biosynthesis